MDTNAIGEVVREARVHAGLTQEQAARAAGVSLSALTRLERGRGAHLSTFAALASLLDLRIDSGALHETRRRRAPRLPRGQRSSPRREDQRAFELHREVVRALRARPQEVIAQGLANVEEMRPRLVGQVGQGLLDEWEHALRQGADGVVALCLRDDDHGDDLRQVGPFLGVLRQDDRLRALQRVS